MVAWSSPDIDDDAAALIHRAFSDGRRVRNPQTRTCLTSGQNISYGTRLPQGGGGDGLHQYYPLSHAKPDETEWYAQVLAIARVSIGDVGDYDVAYVRWFDNVEVASGYFDEDAQLEELMWARGSNRKQLGLSVVTEWEAAMAL